MRCNKPKKPIFAEVPWSQIALKSTISGTDYLHQLVSQEKFSKRTKMLKIRRTFELINFDL